MTFDDIRQYLPKYLSAESMEVLLKSLDDFPSNIDARMYTNKLTDSIIYQGDGLVDVAFYNLHTGQKRIGLALILSNTCDLIGYERIYNPQIVYVPIFSLSKYKILLRGLGESRVDSHIDSLKKQRITSLMYLPAHPTSGMEESVAFLDWACNTNSSSIPRENIEKLRVFSLSDYGHYLFLFKLSVHFTRIQDRVERGSF